MEATRRVKRHAVQTSGRPTQTQTQKKKANDVYMIVNFVPVDIIIYYIWQTNFSKKGSFIKTGFV
jgi:hypothetical protein